MATVASLNIRIAADWSEAKKAFSEVQSAVKPLAGQMQAAGAAMTKYVTLPILAIGGAATKLAGDFEKSFAQMAGLVGVPAEELREFEKAALRVAGITGQGPRELADAFF